jgi:hypothetical protein
MLAFPPPSRVVVPASCHRNSSRETFQGAGVVPRTATNGQAAYLGNYLLDQAATYRKLVERAVDPLVKTELRALASVCDEIADNIEDHLTEDPAPRSPSSRLS